MKIKQPVQFPFLFFHPTHPNNNDNNDNDNSNYNNNNNNDNTCKAVQLIMICNNL